MSESNLVKLFYYYAATENLLEERDAGITSLDEAVDEAFNLSCDDESYIGLITPDANIYKIKSDAYDFYKIYLLDRKAHSYQLIQIGSWDDCNKFIRTIFITR